LISGTSSRTCGRPPAPLDQAQIDLGLAAAGHAMQQMREKPAAGSMASTATVCSAVNIRALDGRGQLAGPGIAPIRRIKPLQANRQRLHHHFAKGRLIVSAGKLAQAEKSAAAAAITQDFAGRLQLIASGQSLLVDDLDDHPHLLATPKGTRTRSRHRRPTPRPHNRTGDAAGDRGRRAKQA
jgi:hypothetical protein